MDNKQHQWRKHLQKIAFYARIYSGRIKDDSIFLLAIISYIFGIILAFQDKAASSTVCFTAGSFLFLIVNLDKIEYFKAFGMEAKLRQTLNEANATVEHLRQLAVSISGPMISMINRLGRWNSAFSQEEKDEFFNNIEKELLAIGIKKSDILELFERNRRSKSSPGSSDNQKD